MICVSALKCLFDNWAPGNLKRSFEIPLTVRVFEAEGEGEGGGKGKTTVVFVDKPLPARPGLTAAEKSEWFHKLAVKATVCVPWVQSHNPNIAR